MPKRTKSSARWLAEHASDEFVKRARAEGWRSRAVFKLAEIQERERLLRPGMRVRRLWAPRPAAGASTRRASSGARAASSPPTSCRWTPSPGSSSCRAIFARKRSLEQVLARGGRRRRSILFCPIWPPTWRVSTRSISPGPCILAELALEFADRVLAPGGDALIKLFQGAGFDEIVREARRRYGRVVTKKPKASRTRSPEIYLLARQFGMV